ncbi:MAG TPA: hypothetical protein VKS01_08610 [Bryobacteraceae bacterium]|nr:hypothetical protein [Bryobacteraceae bacterium]
MPLNPDQEPQLSAPPAVESATPAEIPYRQSWQSRLLHVTFAIFAFEIGLFLVIFPWTPQLWDLNYFSSLSQPLIDFWQGPYFRGAVTGLGLVNIYIALLQVSRIFRRSA